MYPLRLPKFLMKITNPIIQPATGSQRLMPCQGNQQLSLGGINDALLTSPD